MNKKKKTRETIECQFNAYASFWEMVKFFKEKSDQAKNKSNEHYNLSATIVFSAFTFEAFMNHAGNCILKNWNKHEYKSPIKKFKLIINTLKMAREIPADSEEIIANLFEHRNSIAHGRTYYSGVESFVTNDSDKSIKEFLKKESDKIVWKKSITKENIDIVYQSVKDIIEKIHSHVSKNSFKYPNSDSLGMLFSPYEYLGHGKIIED